MYTHERLEPELTVTAAAQIQPLKVISWQTLNFLHIAIQPHRAPHNHLQLRFLELSGDTYTHVLIPTRTHNLK